MAFVRCIETIFVFRFIVEKIDKNKDGEVTEEELREWIQYVQKRYITTDTDRMWKDHTVEGDTLTWDSYKKRTYGFEDGKEHIHCNKYLASKHVFFNHGSLLNHEISWTNLISFLCGSFYV